VILPAIVYTAVLCLTSGCITFMKDHCLTLYISPSGSDTWSGKLASPSENKTDGPLASLEGARDAVRKLRHDGSLTRERVKIVLEAGTYELPGTFRLDSIDSGADSLSPVVYAAARGAEVRITGGRLIKDWQQVSDQSVLNQFRPEVGSYIVQTVADPSGVPDFGSPRGGGAELFFNDQPMHISRYPNKGYMKIAGLINLDPVDIRGTKGDKHGKFIYDDRRISKWVSEKDPWVHGYWFWDWSEERHRIAQIDTVKKILEVLPPYHNYGYRTGQWFYGFNLLSEIDEPGEYYIDRSTGTIYFYPPSDISTAKTYISSTLTLINLNGVSNVSFSGLIFEGCRSTAIRVTNSENVSVVACTIRNTGDAAVEIKGGRKNGVSGCDIYNSGGAGISIEAGDRHTLEPGSCYADNNYIHHIARLKRVYNPGITISGAGNCISHNLIRLVPHMAIGFLGNDHVIEYNEIDSACYESNDAGAIYTGRNWTMRGNQIRFNYLHNISGFEGKGCVGIYLDDAFSSAEIYGNIFRNVTRAMMIGGGRDNKVINNIFVDCVPSVHVDARGLGWMRNEHIPGWIKEAEDSGTILGIAYNKPPYSVRYPELVNILQDEPRAPKGNIISNNICYGGVWDKASGFWHVAIEDKARPYLKMENNVVSPGSQVEDSLSKSMLIADPGFVERSDPEKGKFKLTDGSPALKAGFIQIPFEKIGPHKDKNRASWPVK